jgi:hypothetical protein
MTFGMAQYALAQTSQTPLEMPTVRVEYVEPLPVQPQAQALATIFFDEFSQAPDTHARYFEYDNAQGSFVWSANEGYGGHGGAMRCQFEKGQVTAGSLKVLFGKNPFGRGMHTQETFREIYWRVYVKHEAGWEGNPAKLTRATCLASTDWSQGFIGHVWGGKGDALCIDPATGIRDSHKITTRYNDFDHLHWLGSRQSQTPIFSPEESGRWVCVEAHVRLNSPGKQDGVFELWIDGHLEAARTDLDWQGTWNDYAIDAVFLENYWNQGSVKRQARWFDDFVISTQPIGPIATPTTPTFQCTAQPAAEWQAQVATDGDGQDVVWTSRPTEGAKRLLTIDRAHGTFTGSRAGQRSLASDKTHWLRLRQRSASSLWSAWTAWHAPFHTSSPTTH